MPIAEPPNLTIRLKPRPIKRSDATNGETGYVILGRHGDITNLLPVLRMEAIKAGKPINVVVSEECAGIFDGVNYVTPVAVALDCGKLLQAEAFARTRFKFVRTLQVWGNDQARSHATSHYNEDAWLMAGRLKMFKDPSIKPIFNTRCPVREKRLVDHVRQSNKPILLMAARGGNSSPFKRCASFIEEIMQRWCDSFEIVDLDLIRTQRIYDLIGLMDAASCLVTADSVHLHLAAASNVPVIALLSDRSTWAESSPRCPTLWRGTYRHVYQNMPRIHDAIMGCERFIPKDSPKLIHASDSFTFARIDEPRHREAFLSWLNTDWIDIKPYHQWRSAKSIGSDRDLPFLKDILMEALGHARDQDVVVWTNSDTIIGPGIEKAIREAIKQCPIVTSRRIDVGSGWRHPGRDLAAFSAGWLRENWTSVPDFLCGAAELDNWMAFEARRLLGIQCRSRDIYHDFYPADLPAGFVKHMNHGWPYWDKPEHRYSLPENLYNMRLMSEYVRTWMPTVKLNSRGFIDWNP